MDIGYFYLFDKYILIYFINSFVLEKEDYGRMFFIFRGVGGLVGGINISIVNWNLSWIMISIEVG